MTVYGKSYVKYLSIEMKRKYSKHKEFLSYKGLFMNQISDIKIKSKIYSILNRKRKFIVLLSRQFKFFRIKMSLYLIVGRKSCSISVVGA